MSNSKHTPGPWLRMGRSIGVGAGEIATVWELLDGRAIANARLIAAAPDLLDALVMMLDAYEIPAVRDRARAAIAKATGDTE